MQAYAQSHSFQMDQEMIDYAYALATKYGEASAELACQMYDELAVYWNAQVPPAEPAATATYQEVSKAMNGCMKQSPSGNLISGVADRLVKQAGADTTIKNAIRDGAYWAWIPTGDTCAFCITLASRGWQKASKKVLKGDHAEHIHSHCDCTFAIAFREEDTEKYPFYDPDKYYQQYIDANGNINEMRRNMYPDIAEARNARRRKLYAEMTRRKVAADGHEIIDKPTYNKLTKKFVKAGGIIISGKDANEHLANHAFASYLPGANVAFIRDDATVSDVLEEMYHAEQDRKGLFGNEPTHEVILKREIDAQKYLLSLTEKYNIPVEEVNVTKANLKKYEEELAMLIEGKNEKL